MAVRLHTRIENNTKEIPIQFKGGAETLRVDFGEVQRVGEKAEVYKGDYVVTPKAEDAQVLQTQDKLMKENVTVEKVPFFEVSNLSGGNTVYIAAEVDE